MRASILQTRLVDDLLDASRIVMGKLRVHLRPIDLAASIRAAVEAVRPAAMTKSIFLDCVLDPSVAPVDGDPTRIQQIVWNLLANAIKFTPHGGRVQLVLDQLDTSVRISVNDTGEGIRPDFLPYVFDRFRQGDGTTTRRHGGLGLGLAIVRYLVELHGGSVCADSAGQGKGATFSVTLPISMRAPLSVAAPVDGRVLRLASNEEVPSLEGLRLLLVDDEADCRALIGAVLEQTGAVVRTVSTAADALLSLDEFRPDILISDVAMPGEDGCALIRQIRALRATRWASMPAVALIAYASAEERVRVLAAGFQVHVPKPVDTAELATVIASFFPRRCPTTNPPPISRAASDV
jgi:CheY-like chemotaxis protein